MINRAGIYFVIKPPWIICLPEYLSAKKVEINIHKIILIKHSRISSSIFGESIIMNSSLICSNFYNLNTFVFEASSDKHFTLKYSIKMKKKTNTHFQQTANLQRNYHQSTDYNFIFESTVIIEIPWSLLRSRRSLIVSVHEAQKPLTVATVLWKIFIQIVMTVRISLIRLTCDFWVYVILSDETEVRKVPSLCSKTFLYLRQRYSPSKLT